MKIAIVVQGRFHAFDLARALLRRGHEVTILTNYPVWAARRFGLPGDRIRSFWLHGVLSRIALPLRNLGLLSQPERWLNPMFGKWVARQMRSESWDIVHAWSGVSEEFFASSQDDSPVRFLMRGSSHIRTQATLLEQEEARVGSAIDRPGEWIVAREEREYGLADRIIVLSTFALDSFIAQGVDPTLVSLLPLGTDTRAFRPARNVIEARIQRIRSGEPIRVLYVGAVSCQKGIADVYETVRSLSGRGFRWRFVGPIASDAAAYVRELSGMVEFVGKQPQAELPKWYEWGDVFIFPTIQDGFAAVLAQAHAAGLPILTTANCCGPDLLVEGETGWVLPIRNPQAFVNRLLWCDGHREELAAMIHNAYEAHRIRDWNDVAADFEELCQEKLTVKRRSVLQHG